MNEEAVRPHPPESPREAKARAKAERAYAKASRPWYKKKRIILPSGVLVLMIVAGSTADTETTTPIAAEEPTPSVEEPAPSVDEHDDDAEDALFPDRVDRQREDREAQVGDTISVGGYRAVVTSLEFVQALNDFEDDGYIVADVTLRNDDDKAQPFNTFDWRLQTSEGQVLDPGNHDNIGSGDLVAGGTVSGTVTWDVGDDVTGDYYVIFKPSAWDAARGIWGKTF